MKKLRSLVKSILLAATDRLSDMKLETLAYEIISRRTKRMNPCNALHMLFRMDQNFYKLESTAAIEYEGGVHPKLRLMNYHHFFVKMIKPGERVLDIGCSFGVLARDIAETAGASVVGIDIDEKSIERAKQEYSHPRVDYIAGDATQFLPDGPFDSVVLSNVLEHLTSRPSFLSRIQKKMRPERILIRVPLFERDWRVPLKKELGVEWRLDPTHETEYSMESFEAEVKEANLEIIYVEVRWGEIWAVLKRPHGKGAIGQPSLYGKTV